MNSNIDQEVIDELIAMLEDHIAGGMKPKSAEAPEAEMMEAEPEAEQEPIPGVEASEDDEDMKALMELYSKD